MSGHGIPANADWFIEFQKRNGTDYVYDPRYRISLYANGAVLDDHGMHRDPPADPAQLHDNLVRYAEVRLRHAVAEFDRVKDAMLCEHFTGDRDRGLADLNNLKAEVHRCRDALDAARAAQREADPRIAWEERRAEERARQEAERLKFANLVRSVEV